ncbi:sterol carrier family protein [Hoyosella altamirensis]|uniref:Bacterial SCP orthologue domain-containing protein n=1 Tax=Hoyosella altamirensis TaxID=616997 RepID=A0A839RKJ3_9ACTN|nr:sterol carrier family protein [Hoyosella altamirensis]MBB3037392.1 hypothetical protein [Hoyosella altamirensis]
MTSSSPRRKSVDPAAVRSAIHVIEAWLKDPEPAQEPPKAQLAAAVRLTAQALAQVAPGSSVEVRIPPFVAVQCIEGPRHTRGTPPNVMETDARTWLLIASGLATVDEAVKAGHISISGTRAREIERWLPLVRF